MVKAAGRNLDERRHRAVDSVPKPESSRLEVVKALADQRRIAREHRRGFAHHAVSLAESRRRDCPSSATTPGKFVAKNHGIIHAPAVFAVILMQIASANSNGLYSQQDIFLADLRDGNLPELNRAWLLGVVDQSNH